MRRMKSAEFAKWVAEVGQVDVAKRLTDYYRQFRRPGVSRQAVAAWAAEGVPPLRVLAVEAISGISRHALRPDIYPADDAA